MKEETKESEWTCCHGSTATANEVKRTKQGEKKTADETNRPNFSDRFLLNALWRNGQTIVAIATKFLIGGF